MIPAFGSSRSSFGRTRSSPRIPSGDSHVPFSGPAHPGVSACGHDQVPQDELRGLAFSDPCFQARDSGLGACSRVAFMLPRAKMAP